MTTSPTDIFALAQKRLDWIDQRQQVLSQNIANANTPGYTARDVKSFGAVLAAAARPATNGSAPLDRDVSEKSINGNAVVLDDQLEKVAETDTAQQLATNLYKKYVGLFRTAIGRN